MSSTTKRSDHLRLTLPLSVYTVGRPTRLDRYGHYVSYYFYIKPGISSTDLGEVFVHEICAEFYEARCRVTVAINAKQLLKRG